MTPSTTLAITGCDWGELKQSKGGSGYWVWDVKDNLVKVEEETGFEGRDESKKKRITRDTRKRSKRVLDRSLGDLSLFQAFAMEHK